MDAIKVDDKRMEQAVAEARAMLSRIVEGTHLAHFVRSQSPASGASNQADQQLEDSRTVGCAG